MQNRTQAAIKVAYARLRGEFDDPGLMAFGPLTTDPHADALAILDQCNAPYLNRRTLDCAMDLMRWGFTVGDRDPRLNREFKGRFMVVEAHEESELPTDDGSNGPWCIVGDDLTDLIRRSWKLWVGEYGHYVREG